MNHSKDNLIEVGDWVTIYYNGLERLGYIADFDAEQCELVLGSLGNTGYEAFGETITVARTGLRALGMGRWLCQCQD